MYKPQLQMDSNVRSSRFARGDTVEETRIPTGNEQREPGENARGMRSTVGRPGKLPSMDTLVLSLMVPPPVAPTFKVLLLIFCLISVDLI